MEDNERTGQTEEIIKQALNYRAQKHGGSTTPQWSKIMEETNNNKNRAKRKNTILAVAASVLAIATLSSVLFALNQPDETQSTNKGEKVSTSTTTTSPLTEEQALLKDTIALKEVNVRNDENGQRLHDLQAVDGLTGNVDEELTKLINDQKIFNPMVVGVSKGFVQLKDGVSPSCDTYTTYIFDINKKTVVKVQEDISSYGASPSGKQLADSVGIDCNNITEQSGDIALELDIKDTTTGKVRTIKPENYKLDAGDGSSIDAQIYVADFLWVDESSAVIGISITQTNGMNYHLVDLSKPVSLNSLVDKTPISGGSDGYLVPVSAARIDGQVYILMIQNEFEKNQLIARTAESETRLWTTTLPSTSYGEYSFGSSQFSAYGTHDGKAIAHDGKAGNTSNPDGVAIIKK